MTRRSNESLSSVDQTRSRKRTRYCCACQRNVDSTNWARHVRSNSHLGATSSVCDPSDDILRPQTPRGSDSLSNRSMSSRRAAKICPRDVSPPAISLTEMRCCAAAVFSSGAVSYDGFYLAASRVFPRIPSAIRQAIAVTAELFAPVVRGAMTLEGHSVGSNDTVRSSTGGVRPRAKSSIGRAQSCPPGLKSTVSLVESSRNAAPSNETVLSPKVTPPRLTLVNEKLPSVNGDVEPPSRMSPVAFDPILPDILFNESFNLGDVFNVRTDTYDACAVEPSQVQPEAQKGRIPSNMVPSFSTPLRDTDRAVASAKDSEILARRARKLRDDSFATEILVPRGATFSAASSLNSVTGETRSATPQHPLQISSSESDCEGESHGEVDCDHPKPKSPTPVSLRGRELRVKLTRVPIEMKRPAHGSRSNLSSPLVKRKTMDRGYYSNRDRRVTAKSRPMNVVSKSDPACYKRKWMPRRNTAETLKVKQRAKLSSTRTQEPDVAESSHAKQPRSFRRLGVVRS
jgi:hypothetical protein